MYCKRLSNAQMKCNQNRNWNCFWLLKNHDLCTNPMVSGRNCSSFFQKAWALCYPPFFPAGRQPGEGAVPIWHRPSWLHVLPSLWLWHLYGNLLATDTLVHGGSCKQCKASPFVEMAFPPPSLSLGLQLRSQPGLPEGCWRAPQGCASLWPGSRTASRRLGLAS